MVMPNFHVPGRRAKIFVNNLTDCSSVTQKNSLKYGYLFVIPLKFFSLIFILYWSILECS